MDQKLRETTKCNVTQNIVNVLRTECYTTFIMYAAADSKIVVICEHQTVDNRITAGCVSSLCQFKFCLLISQACESTSCTVEYFGTRTQDIFLKTWRVGSWPIVSVFISSINKV
jgi:hypothetical protein